MPTKIRLQRSGKKGRPFYHIVIADGRAPRDGKYIEKIGNYNPLTKPADVTVDFDRALYWLQTGAQPTDTVRAILTYKGVIYKNHLLKGVKKEALSEAQAEEKFEVWLTEKEARIAGKVKDVENDRKTEENKRFDAEKKINEERAKELAARQEEELKKLEAEKAAAQPKQPQEEAPAEEKPAEQVKEEKKEEPLAEAKQVDKPDAGEKKEELTKPKAEEKKEEPKVEKPVEKPEKKEDKTEEKPAEQVKEEKKEEPLAEAKPVDKPDAGEKKEELTKPEAEEK